MLNLTNPKTIEDFAVSTIVDKAKLHDNYLLFWADLLNYASGNVAGIISIFEWAGVSTNDIEVAYNQLRKL